jgi:hypothetical protein
VLEKRIKEIKQYGCFELDFIEHIENYRYIFLPNSKTIHFWEIFILILITFSVIVLPMETGLFIIDKLAMPEINGQYHYVGIEFFISLCLIFDLIFNFRTARYSKRGDLILNLSQIKQEYLRGYFFIDLFSIPPIDLIIYCISGKTSSSDPFLLISKLPRLLRIVKLIKSLMKIKRGTILQAFILFLSYYLIAHYFACIICYTENYQKYDQFNIETLFTNMYSKYTSRAILILCGNNFLPINFAQRIIFVIMFYTGTLCDAIIFGNMAILFSKVNPIEKNKNKNFDEINLLMDTLQLKKELKHEILDYQETLWWKHREKFLNNKFLKDMNHNLLTRLRMMLLQSNLFEISDFFNSEKFSKNFIISLSKKLESYLTHPHDIVTFEGVVEQKMFFISKKGKFQVKTNGNIIKYLIEGEYFGEISLFLKAQTRIATIISMNTSVLYYINSKQINKLIYNFPFEGKEIYDKAISRFKETTEYMGVELKRKIIDLSGDFNAVLLNKHDIRSGIFNFNGKTHISNNIWNDDILVMLNKLVNYQKQK